MCGIIKSSKTADGCSWRIDSRASTPFVAVNTSYPLVKKAIRNSSRISFSSSTTRTDIAPIDDILPLVRYTHVLPPVHNLTHETDTSTVIFHNCYRIVLKAERFAELP